MEDNGTANHTADVIVDGSNDVDVDENTCYRCQGAGDDRDHCLENLKKDKERGSKGARLENKSRQDFLGLKDSIKVGPDTKGKGPKSSDDGGPKEETAMVSSRKNESTLMSLLLYIEKHYASTTLDEMGEHFGFNPNYLSSYLKKHTGKSFIKLLHLQRVNAAADYLLYTNAPIEKIAAKVGYENPSYFYKIFKKILGMSPAEYRNSGKGK